MRTVGIIPARYGSERLPGKPLLDIGGKPMLWRVYQRVRDVPGLDAVFAATDDQRIFRVCQELGIPARMTDPGHRTAAGRLWEASEMIPAFLFPQYSCGPAVFLPPVWESDAETTPWPLPELPPARSPGPVHTSGIPYPC